MANHISEQTSAADKLALRKAIRSLPDAQYDAVLYCDIIGFSTPELATILGINARVVRKNLKAARLNLQKILSS